METKLSEEIADIENFISKYTESGLGKGAPNGTGATCKRIDDFVDNSGDDINNSDQFVEVIQMRCLEITCIAIDVKDIQCPQRLDDDIAGMSGTRNSYYNTGDHVLIKYPTKNVECSYVAVINEIDDDENDLRVTFIKIYDHKVQTFKINDKDISDVSFDQGIQNMDDPD
ncbi:hypothetical protein HHI36_005262 [Cryptolaemus montrouzieri]|uniref:Uncharacterized protein n=1 Tax=Cryptolaemus montrouzieri TaxID=559131 RepID=A0ABD2NU52_9CUCU